MRHSKSIQAALIGIVALVMAPSGSYAEKPTFPSSPPPAKVCYCHNVNHHAVTVCTADRAFQMGHSNHVNNGIDLLGECVPPACGNGILEEGEVCDDGDTVTNVCDYGQTECTVCAADCTEQPGDTSFCGDTSVDAANGEECDDGNTVDGDGCSSLCLVEVSSTCGDLSVEGDEQCECEDKTQQCGVDRIQPPITCPGGTILCV